MSSDSTYPIGIEFPATSPVSETLPVVESKRPCSSGRAADAAQISLIGRTRSELETLCVEMGEPPYRGRQIAQWIYGRGVRSPGEMTDLPASLRTRLAEIAAPGMVEVMRRQTARDGAEKFLFRLDDGESVETVVLPFPDRTSICVSSQVGCPIRCTFCATGRSGYSRNLTAGEIVDQVLEARQISGRRITHVVFMGMGEPLMNTREVLKAARLMRDELGIPMRHITISTVGLVPEMKELAREGESFTLAVSLHAPNDVLRQSLIPVARRYPLKEILAACDEFQQITGRRVTFEYVLLRGVNDRPEDAAQLAALLTGRRAHVNLIPYNPGASDEYRAPRSEEVTRFRQFLERAGIAVTQRMERGQEIMAACGQLRKQVPPALEDISERSALPGPGVAAHSSRRSGTNRRFGYGEHAVRVR